MKEKMYESVFKTDEEYKFESENSRGLFETKKRKLKEADDSVLDQIIATIDLSPLEDEVKKRIGIGVVFLIKKQRGSRSNYLGVASKDLTKYTGIFKNIYKYCVLQTFNSDINDKESTWWMTLNFSFEYESGGSNGTQLLTSWYNYETKEWTFR